MQISIENVQQRKDPYQLFLDSFKIKETGRKYNNWLYRFLNLIPAELFEGGKISKCQDVGTLARSFVTLARKNPDLAKNIIAEYIKEEKRLADTKQLNPNTIPNHVKPIKALLDANGVPIHWKSLYNCFLGNKKQRIGHIQKKNCKN